MRNRKIAVALGGGGMRGLAHIGVLKALTHAGVRPATYSGCSIGAVFAAAAAVGASPQAMESCAMRWATRALFRPDLLGLLGQRHHGGGLFSAAPLKRLCAELFGNATFGSLACALLISTVDVDAAEAVCWTAETTPDVRVADAVYASCAMPGLLPPARVGGRLCMDGAVLDPLALHALAGRGEAIICVDVGSCANLRHQRMGRPSALNILRRASTIVSERMTDEAISAWCGGPLIVARPAVGHVKTLRARDPAGVIDAGYAAGCAALDRLRSFDARGLRDRNKCWKRVGHSRLLHAREHAIRLLPP